jgi:hypothetical protein
VAERADPPMDAMIRWRVVLFAAKLPVASVGEAATRCFAFIEALLCHSSAHAAMRPWRRP